VANAKGALEQKKERLELARRRQTETKKRLENEFLATNGVCVCVCVSSLSILHWGSVCVCVVVVVVVVVVVGLF
jgi:hypothetical protein